MDLNGSCRSGPQSLLAEMMMGEVCEMHVFKFRMLF
jgi:hypothetical protein